MVDIIGSDSYKKPNLLDMWSCAHIFSGIISYIIFHRILKLSLVVSFILWNLIHLLYELKDYYFTYIKKYTIRPIRSNNLIDLGFHSDNSWENSIADLIIGIIGFGIGHLLLRKR
tara:strand:+ start:1376 stop:1720 length:345 start_codon:yes stop_codon:yes gene_type:complete